jgi:hypothetical protein
MIRAFRIRRIADRARARRAGGPGGGPSELADGGMEARSPGNPRIAGPCRGWSERGDGPASVCAAAGVDDEISLPGQLPARFSRGPLSPRRCRRSSPGPGPGVEGQATGIRLAGGFALEGRPDRLSLRKRPPACEQPGASEMRPDQRSGMFEAPAPLPVRIMPR